MAVVNNKRLCWNCEGEVHEQAVRCAYCGAELSGTIETPSSHPLPPYELPQEKQEQRQIPSPPYATSQTIAATHEVSDDEWSDAFNEAQEQEIVAHVAKDTILPLVMLSIGSVCFMFALALLFFGENGLFSLQWNADRWPLYLVTGIISSFIGWRALRTLR